MPPGLVPASGSGVGADSRTLDEIFGDAKIDRDPLEDDLVLDPNAAVIHPWEQSFFPPSNEEQDMWGPVAADQPAQDLWGSADRGVTKPVVAQCPYHAHTCKKGVCSWRAKQVKLEEKEQELAKKGGKRGALFFRV